MRMIPVIAAGLIAAASFATPAQAQHYRHGWHGGHHQRYDGHRGGYGWHRGYGWHHRRYARLVCSWRYHHRVCRRVWY